MFDSMFNSAVVVPKTEGPPLEAWHLKPVAKFQPLSCQHQLPKACHQKASVEVQPTKPNIKHSKKKLLKSSSHKAAAKAH